MRTTPRRRLVPWALALAGLAVSPIAGAEERAALIIGNDGYRHLPDLRNGKRDAKGMAAKLRTLGFDVTLKLDAGEREMLRALDAFEGKISRGAVGLVYFAGHGIQSGGSNYLIPVDAQLEVEADLEAEALPASRFLAAMERAGNPLNILILDACRDNPLPRRTRSAKRGLSVVGLPAGAKGTAILYAAGPGQAAADGKRGGHGVFTAAFLQALDDPGLTLEQVFKRTSRGVLDATNGKQRPWSLASLQGDFFFHPQAGRRTRPPPAAPQLADAEIVFWQSVADSGDQAMFEEYLRQYPGGRFAGLARLKIGALQRRDPAPSQAPVASPEPSRSPASLEGLWDEYWDGSLNTYPVRITVGPGGALSIRSADRHTGEPRGNEETYSGLRLDGDVLRYKEGGSGGEQFQVTLRIVSDDLLRGTIVSNQRGEHQRELRRIRR